ncbi:hypothetical protein M9H77_15272 [Catharanthus roseus]|uniref:Uncharacterized protein n=1 Tax=Catharanthus roseus TaxID=4058 RepID=A0ACC0AY17_CATRO|nr:hypothetical protein M9H77_15272 [Catharanthus roseus]
MTKSKISMAARGVASIFTLTAAILMGTNSQSIQVVDFIFTAKYTDWDSFRNFMIVNSIASVLHFIAILLPSGTPVWRLIAGLDMLSCVVLVGCWGSALTCFEVLKNGSRHIGWAPICGAVPHFCSRALAAIVTSFIGLFIGFLFCCIDVHYLINPLLLTPN